MIIEVFKQTVELDKLCCPECASEEIKPIGRASLACTNCGATYPIAAATVQLAALDCHIRP